MKEGDWVLVLLPENSHKLLSQWQGPFQVTRKLGPINYEVQRTSPIRRKQNYHTNMLKKWKGKKARLIQGEGEGGDLDDIGYPMVSEFMVENLG